MKIQLSDFSYIDRGRRGGAILGKALRFTLSFRFFLEEGDMGEIAWEGNMAFYGATGLKWSPPINRFSASCTQQLHWINPKMYDKVLEALLTKPHLLEPLNTAIQTLLKKKKEEEKVKEVVELSI